jgi:two-component system OmpR family response regulator
MAKILLLEDDPVLGKGLAVHLETAGYEVVWETSLTRARATETQTRFDLLILDLNLPDGSGFDLCRDVRARGSRLPIMMLTARTDDDSVVDGFEAGANDYIKKPFSNRELLVRIQTQLKEPFLREEQIRCGPVLVLVSQRKVLIDGTEIDFNRREFDIFCHLTKSPGAVVSREQVIQAIDSSDNILDRTIDSHLSHIRNKLKKKNVRSVAIRSVYGVGYTLELS